MSDGFTIPQDMIVESSPQRGTVVSIRDFMLLLGATDQQLRDMDERDEILSREPWRKAGLRFVPVGRKVNGMQLGHMKGKIDWSGTRFAEPPLTSDHPIDNGSEK